MNDLRLHAVVARVVAWHNSHPLARRISAAQVNSVGYVALPYTAPGLPPPPPPPPAVPLPAPPLAEPVDIDPVVETDDPGDMVIDVDPEPRASAVAAVDADAMTLEVDLPAATLGDAPRGDLPAGAQPTSEAGPQVDEGSSEADPAAPVPPSPAAQPVSSLRARAAAGEGDSVANAADGPAQLSALPALSAPRTLVCSKDFIAPLPIKRVLDWVRQHGLALQFAPADGPVHQVPVDKALLPPGAGVAQLWVATAAIEVRGQRHRLLLGSGAEPAVLGRRAWSRPRLLGALAAPGVMAAAAVWWMWPATSAAPAAALPTLAAAGASAASAASAPEASASAATVDAEQHEVGTRPPRLPGLLDDDAKARARATVAALRADRAASAPATPAAAAAAAAVTPTPAAAPATPTPPAVPAPPGPQAAAPTAVLYGLSTRLLRTRAEAEQLRSAFQALLVGTAGTSLRVEMLPAGEDWRVVCWPYEKRADAERARALLQARGLRAELVDF